MVTGRLAVTLVGAPGPYVVLIKTKGSMIFSVDG